MLTSKLSFITFYYVWVFMSKLPLSILRYIWIFMSGKFCTPVFSCSLFLVDAGRDTLRDKRLIVSNGPWDCSPARRILYPGQSLEACLSVTLYLCISIYIYIYVSKFKYRYSYRTFSHVIVSDGPWDLSRQCVIHIVYEGKNLGYIQKIHTYMYIHDPYPVQFYPA